MRGLSRPRGVKSSGSARGTAVTSKPAGRDGLARTRAVGERPPRTALTALHGTFAPCKGCSGPTGSLRGHRDTCFRSAAVSSHSATTGMCFRTRAAPCRGSAARTSARTADARALPRRSANRCADPLPRWTAALGARAGTGARSRAAGASTTDPPTRSRARAAVTRRADAG